MEEWEEHMNYTKENHGFHILMDLRKHHNLVEYGRDYINGG